MTMIHDDHQDPDGASALMVGRIEEWEPGTVTLHSHQKHQLMFAIRGVLHVTTPTSEWILPPSRAIWISANTSHSVTLKQPALASVLYVQSYAQIGSDMEPCVVLDAPPLVKELITACTGFAWDYSLDSSEARIAQVLLDQLNLINQAPVNLPIPIDTRALAVADAVRAEPGSRKSLSEIAAAQGLSSRTVERLFRGETGLSFGAWRLRVRLIAGVELLAYGMPVAAVAVEVGYGAASAFVAAFKEMFGVTPARYYE